MTPCSRIAPVWGHIIPSWMLLQGKKISCPTCRTRTKVTDVAYVDNGRGVASQEGDGGEGSCSIAAQEAAIQVKGSYGTKVSPPPPPLGGASSI